MGRDCLSVGLSGLSVGLIRAGPDACVCACTARACTFVLTDTWQALQSGVQKGRILGQEPLKNCVLAQTPTQGFSL